MKKDEFLKRRSPFSEYLGIKTVKNGQSFRMKVQPKHTNAHGYAHGGAIFTLADRAFACAVNAKGRTAVAMEMKINYLAPVKNGDMLEAKAKIIKQGKKTTICLIEVKRQQELVAIVLATAYNITKN